MWWCPEKGAIKNFKQKTARTRIFELCIHKLPFIVHAAKDTRKMALMTIKNNVMLAKIAQEGVSLATIISLTKAETFAKLSVVITA